MSSLFRPLCLVAALTALSFLADHPAAAQENAGQKAGQKGCDAIVATLLKTGEAPRVSISTKKRTVQVKTSQGTCEEPISVWVSRKWSSSGSSSTPKTETQPAPAKAPAAAETPALKSPEAVKPIVVIPEPSSPVMPKFTPWKGPCDRQVKDYWNSGWFAIGGRRYWLQGVYTIDLDRDSKTDNVGFRFKSDEGPEVVLRYIASAGLRSARSIRELRLLDDDIIPRLCFGQRNFDKPLLVTGISSKQFALPNLAEEAKAKRTPQKKETDSSEVFWFSIIGGGFLLLVIVGGLIYWMVEQRKENDREVYGEDDEDEEDEEDEKELA